MTMRHGTGPAFWSGMTTYTLTVTDTEARAILLALVEARDEREVLRVEAERHGDSSQMSDFWVLPSDVRRQISSQLRTIFGVPNSETAALIYRLQTTHDATSSWDWADDKCLGLSDLGKSSLRDIACRRGLVPYAFKQ